MMLFYVLINIFTMRSTHLIILYCFVFYTFYLFFENLFIYAIVFSSPLPTTLSLGFLLEPSAFVFLNAFGLEGISWGPG